jgi:hypothetical protein
VRPTTRYALVGAVAVVLLLLLVSGVFGRGCSGLGVGWY